MKIKLILFVSCLFLVFSGFSQKILAMGQDTVASIDALGIVYDVSGVKIGEITPAGEIKNANGVINGTITSNKFLAHTGDVIAELKQTNSSTEILGVGDLLMGKVIGNQIQDVNGKLLLIAYGEVTNSELIAYFLFF